MTMLALPSDAADDVPSWRPVFVTALVTIACLTTAATGWGMFARLDSAVTAHGVLLAESERKTVENLEGGILERLLVQPGDRVTEGQIVAMLDTTQIREQRTQLAQDAEALAFDIWRLEAEEAEAGALDAASAPEAPATVRDKRTAAQQRLFDARLRAHVGAVTSLRREIDQLTGRIAASAAQAEAAESQRLLWTQERDLNAALVEKGATPRQRLLELDRTIAMLVGERDESRGLIAASEQERARAAVEIDNLEQQRRVEIAERLSEARRLVDGLQSRIRAASDVLDRHALRAPQAGLVVDIHTRTPGAVIGSGMVLMEILPDGDRLVVRTRIPPEAIDTVHVGRHADVRLTAYPRAQLPVVAGEVTYVSADFLEDERDGSAYFEARVTIDPASVAALPDVHLTAGMPVEVAIQTGERRAGDYILSPILRRLGNAFTEE